MTDWSYFVLASLPVDAGEDLPFPISSLVLSTGGSRRIYASQAMSQLDAILLRWRVATDYHCLVEAEVVYSPVDDPFQTGRT